MATGINRLRKKHPKTRFGCRTCRDRRIKCDEGRPECARCVKAGRICNGYEMSRPTEHQTGGVLLPKHPAISSIARQPSIVPTALTSAEGIAFDFFRLHTIYNLPGSSRTLSWQRLTLRMSYEEPAVRHAVVALAAIHRSQMVIKSGSGSESVDEGQYSFALSQYSTSISYLRSYIDSHVVEKPAPSTVEAVLLLTLLFFCFNVLRRDDDEAYAHVSRGFQILRHSVEPEKVPSNKQCKWRLVPLRADPRDGLELLTQTFVRLDSDDALAPGKSKTYLTPVSSQPLPASFSCLDEAMVHLDVANGELRTVLGALLDSARQILRSQPICPTNADTLKCLTFIARRDALRASAEPEDYDEIKSKLAAWMSAYTMVPWDPKDEVAYILTNIHYFYLWLMANTSESRYQSEYDPLLSQFENIIRLAERFVFLDRVSLTNRTGRRSPLRNQTTGTHIIVTVCEIGLRCRDSALRRRCIDILQALNLEGVCDGHFLASWIQSIMEIEEASAMAMNPALSNVASLRCEDIPEEARVLDTLIVQDWDDGVNVHNFYKMAQSRILVAKYQDDLDGDIVIEETGFVVDRMPTVGKAKAASDSLGSLAT